MISRAAVVQTFLDLFEHPRYLEIGVNRGETFHALKAGRKVAVDPYFLFDKEQREAEPGVEYHEVTSDEYFGLIHDGGKFDVVFIDGLHTFDQTLKDLLNCQLVLQEHGVMIVDDVIPNSYDASLRDFTQVAVLREKTRELGLLWQTDGSWMGDVFKIPFFVDQFLQQMSFATVAENHGQCVVWRQVRRGVEMPEADFDGVSRLDFRDTVLRRSGFRLRPLAQIAADVAHAYASSSDAGTTTSQFRSIPLPEDGLLTRVEVEGEQTPMPKVSYAELMPDSVRKAQTRIWGTFRPKQTVQVHRLSNVYVVGQGLAFNTRGEVYDVTTAKTPTTEVRAAADLLKIRLHQAPPPRHYGAHLLCGQAGLYNYGHWLVEMLPAAFVLQTKTSLQDWKVYVPKIYPWMASVVRDSLDLLQIEAPRRIEGDGEPAWFEELIVVSGMSQQGSFYLPVTAKCLQAIATGIESDGSDKVWVSRLGEKRALLCEAEINERLTGQGWKVMLPRNMTLREQIAACKGARVMAGVNGAGLTNMAFMPSGGRVTSLIPAHMPDLFFWALAVNRRLAFHEVRSPTLPPEEIGIAWDVALTISAEKVMKLIA